MPKENLNRREFLGNLLEWGLNAVLVLFGYRCWDGRHLNMPAKKPKNISHREASWYKNLAG